MASNPRTATRKLVEELVADEEIELVELDEDAYASFVEQVATEIKQYGEDPDEHAHRLADWLEKHPCVEELFVEDDVLGAKLAAWNHAVNRGRLVFDPDRPSPRNPQLEQQILDDPDDDGFRVVYGDWLLEQGDPLGELVARHGEDAGQKLLSRHKAYFFGPVAEYRRMFDLEFHFGFIRSLALSRARAFQIEWRIVVAWLLELPIARFVERITIGSLNSNYDAEVEVFQEVLARPRNALRFLAVDSMRRRYGVGESLDFTLLATSAPRLEQLDVRAVRGRSEPIEHPRLRRMSLVLESMLPDLASALGASTFAMLEELEIRTSLQGPPSALLSAQMPALRTLRLTLNQVGSTLVKDLVASPLLAQLTELELADVDDEAAATLLSSSRHFAHLEKLVLPNKRLSRGARRALVDLRVV